MFRPWLPEATLRQKLSAARLVRLPRIEQLAVVRNVSRAARAAGPTDRGAVLPPNHLGMIEFLLLSKLNLVDSRSENILGRTRGPMHDERETWGTLPDDRDNCLSVPNTHSKCQNPQPRRNHPNGGARYNLRTSMQVD